MIAATFASLLAQTSNTTKCDVRKLLYRNDIFGDSCCKDASQPWCNALSSLDKDELFSVLKASTTTGGLENTIDMMEKTATLWFGSTSRVKVSHFSTGIPYFEWNQFKADPTFFETIDLSSPGIQYVFCLKPEERYGGMEVLSKCGLPFSGMNDGYIKLFMLMSNVEQTFGASASIIVDRYGNLAEVLSFVGERDDTTGLYTPPAPIWASYRGSSYPVSNTDETQTLQMSDMPLKLRNMIVNFFKDTQEGELDANDPKVQYNVTLEDPINVPSAIAIETLIIPAIPYPLRTLLYQTDEFTIPVSVFSSLLPRESTARSLDADITGVDLLRSSKPIVVAATSIHEFKSIIDQFRPIFNFTKLDW